jgi:hypothetical protein
VTAGSGPVVAPLTGLAAERPPGYDVGGRRDERDRSGRGRDVDRSGRGGPDRGGEGPAGAVAAALALAVDGVRDVDVDALADPEVHQLLRHVQAQLDRLTGARDRLAAVRRRRAVIAAGPGRESQATRRAEQELADDLRLSPSEAKRSSAAGRQLEARPELASAVDDGRVRPEQAQVIGRCLDGIGAEDHDEAFALLAGAAAQQDPIELGRTARRLAAEMAPDAAVQDERRRHARRRLTLRRTADGMLDVHGQLTGLAAEAVQTAIDAFRTPDRAGDPARTAEQRTADAFEELALAALRAGEAPSDRGVRPQLTVTVDLDRLHRGTGAGEAAWHGPIPTAELQRFARNATIRVLGLDVDGLPIASSVATDHVTAAQYRALVHRDGGCRYPGCDAPPAWCDVAHATARRDDGPVALHNTLLLCRRHHRYLDLGAWRITVDRLEARFTHPDGRTIAAAPARGRPPDRGSGPEPPGATEGTGASGPSDVPDG